MQDELAWGQKCRHSIRHAAQACPSGHTHPPHVCARAWCSAVEFCAYLWSAAAGRCAVALQRAEWQCGRVLVGGQRSGAERSGAPPRRPRFAAFAAVRSQSVVCCCAVGRQADLVKINENTRKNLELEIRG